MDNKKGEPKLRAESAFRRSPRTPSKVDQSIIQPPVVSAICPTDVTSGSVTSSASQSTTVNAKVTWQSATVQSTQHSPLVPAISTASDLNTSIIPRKANSVTSSMSRRAALALQRLEEERELRARRDNELINESRRLQTERDVEYLNQKYEILEYDVNDQTSPPGQQQPQFLGVSQSQASSSNQTRRRVMADDEMKQRVEILEHTIITQNEEIIALKSEIVELKTEIAELKTENSDLRANVDELRESLKLVVDRYDAMEKRSTSNRVLNLENAADEVMPVNVPMEARPIASNSATSTPPEIRNLED